MSFEHFIGTADQKEELDYVVARLRDYWGRRTPWQRRLWNPGSLAMLDEIVEAAELLDRGHLSAEGVKELASAVKRPVGRDVGIGPREVRNAIHKVLDEVAKDPHAVRQLAYLKSAAHVGYLDRWHKHLDAAAAGATEPEHLSRVLGAYLLDLGFSPDQLHRWVGAVGRDFTDVTGLVAAAIDLVRRERQWFHVLVPIMSLPRGGHAMPSNWLEPDQARAWLHDNNAGRTVRQNGGLLYEVSARDPWAAVEQASDLIQSLGARIVVGLPANQEFRTTPNAYVRGSTREFPMRRPRRQVDVHSLSRQSALFDAEHPGLSGRLRSALDLLAPLETGAPGAAVAGGWAAVEALLARPGTPNVVAAAGMASLVACSLPRAELTTLAYAHIETGNGALAEELRAAATNRERCVLLANAVASGAAPSLPKLTDRAAGARVEAILANPAETLERIRAYTDMAFRRLYRQRNMVLHDGKTDSVTMLATLRSAPPLVGAAVDRIVHAALQSSPEDAHQLVARAAVELKLVGKPGGRHVADLLGA